MVTNETEFDYYLIKNTGVPSVPLIMNNDDMNPEDYGLDVAYSDTYEEVNSPIYLAINPPYPAKPNFNVDFLQYPGAVYSQKVHDVLIKLNIKDYQHFSSIIVDRKGGEHTGFWIEHVYNHISCIDTEKSTCEYISFGKTWGHFERIVLKNELLKKIPLKNRLIFYPKETYEFVLYHKSIADAIMAINPINIQFIAVSEYGKGQYWN